MRIPVLAASLSGLLVLGASSARAHDEGCDYEYGNPYVVHHDHHYVVPNDDYGYRRQYYNTGYGQQYYRHHRRHRTAFSVFFGG